MKGYRIVAIALVVLLVGTLVAGCSDKVGEETTAPTVTSAEETTAETTTGKPDLGNYVLTIVSPWIDGWQPDTTTSLGAQLKSEYDKIETDYNFKLKLEAMPEDSEALMAQIISGNYAADIYDIKTNVSMSYGMQGLIVDWKSQQMKDLGIDVDDSELYNLYLSRLSAVGDAQYGLQVASEYYLPQFGYGIMFNKSIADSMGYKADDLYQKVRDGNWTFSEYLLLAEELSEDTDNDGVVDIYSAGGGDNPYGAEVYLAGGSPVTYQDGKWTYTLDSAAGIAGLEFMREVFYSSGTRFTGGAGTSREMFRDGTCSMLWAAGFYLSNDVIKSCVFDFGLLPMPKSSDMDHYVDVISTPRHLTMMKGNVNENAVKAFLLWCGVMNNEQGWKDYMLNESLRGDEQAFEMVTEYIMPYTVLNTSSLVGSTNSIFNNEIYKKVRTSEMTPMQAAQAKKNEVQGVLDEFFNQ